MEAEPEAVAVLQEHGVERPSDSTLRLARSIIQMRKSPCRQLLLEALMCADSMEASPVEAMGWMRDAVREALRAEADLPTQACVRCRCKFDFVWRTASDGTRFAIAMQEAIKVTLRDGAVHLEVLCHECKEEQRKVKS